MHHARKSWKAKIMNFYIFLLIIALPFGARLGYDFKDAKRLWIFADLIWTCTVIFSAVLALNNIDKSFKDADRSFALRRLAHAQNSIRTHANLLEKNNCAISKSVTVGSSAKTKSQEEFCATIRDALSFSGRSNFLGADATNILNRVELFKEKYFPDGSFSLFYSLKEYAQIYADMKEELEALPHQSPLNMYEQFEKWIYLIWFLLVLRLGKTFAEWSREPTASK
jgi:DNA modification methylase